MHFFSYRGTLTAGGARSFFLCPFFFVIFPSIWVRTPPIVLGIISLSCPFCLCRCSHPGRCLASSPLICMNPSFLSTMAILAPYLFPTPNSSTYAEMPLQQKEQQCLSIPTSCEKCTHVYKYLRTTNAVVRIKLLYSTRTIRPFLCGPALNLV